MSTATARSAAMVEMASSAAARAGQMRPLWSMFERIKDVDHPDEQMLSVFRDYGVVAKDSRGRLESDRENRSIYQLVHPGWLVTNRMKAWQGSVGISSLRGIVLRALRSVSHLCASEDPATSTGYSALGRTTDAYALMSRRRSDRPRRDRQRRILGSCRSCFRRSTSSAPSPTTSIARRPGSTRSSRSSSG